MLTFMTSSMLHRKILRLRPHKSCVCRRVSLGGFVPACSAGRVRSYFRFQGPVTVYNVTGRNLDRKIEAGTVGDKGVEWHEQLNSFLMKHDLSIFHNVHVEAIIDRAKLQHVEQFSSSSTSCSTIVYRTSQPEYRYAEYLSSVRCISNRRLLSRFRCGCHGLHVGTGRWVDTKREDRLCQVCHSSKDVEDEQHFLFSCSAYSDVT